MPQNTEHARSGVCTQLQSPSTLEPECPSDRDAHRPQDEPDATVTAPRSQSSNSESVQENKGQSKDLVGRRATGGLNSYRD